MSLKVTPFERIVVVGNSGSGKTTVARSLASALNLPHVELDSIHHQADWTPLSPDEFNARVTELVAEDKWIVDGNYFGVRDVVWSRAQAVVWPDLPRRHVMRQLAQRSLLRRLTRQKLWNGNRESWRTLISRDPDLNILLYAWRSHESTRVAIELALRDPRYSHLQLMRLRSRREVRTVRETFG